MIIISFTVYYGEHKATLRGNCSVKSKKNLLHRLESGDFYKIWSESEFGHFAQCVFL